LGGGGKTETIVFTQYGILLIDEHVRTFADIIPTCPELTDVYILY